MRAVLIGAVDSTRIAAAALAQAPGWTLTGLVTLPLDLAARHSDFVDLSPDAAAANCPLLRVANGNAPAAIEQIAALEPDYLFVIGWSQLCGEALMQITPGRVVGYHPAPLPRLRGRGVIPWTILLDEPITAGTLFLIDAGTDSGPILAQRYFHVAADETARTLYDKHMAALAAMLPPTLAQLAAGTAQPQVQDARYATYAARRRPEDGEIDWCAPADVAWRTVRACGLPYPGARTAVGDQPLIVRQATTIDLACHRAALPGQVVEVTADAFVVACGDRRGLRVTDWHWHKPGPPPVHVKLQPRAPVAA